MLGCISIIARLRREHWTGRILAMMSEEEESPLKTHPAVTFPRVLTDNGMSSTAQSRLEQLA